MGKAVAIGGGRYSDGEINNILKYIFDLSKKENPLITILPTAAFDNCNEATDPIPFFNSLGADVNILKVSECEDKTAHEKILNSDIIYVLGGNLEFLMQEWKKHGITECMKTAFSKGIILSGYSSGSMCWFKRGYDDCGKDNSFVFADCIGILPFCNCVHYESDSWQSFTERCKEQNLPSIALDDGSALVYNDGEYSLIFGSDEESSAYFIDNKIYSKREIKQLNKKSLNDLLNSVLTTENTLRRDAEMAYITDKECMKEIIEARRKFQLYNLIDSRNTKLLREKAYDLLGGAGENLTIVQPFYCDYGKNIYTGDNFFANYGCTILDVGKVTIGNNVFLAPHVSIYTAGHPIDATMRNSGYEYGIAVSIGNDCWIGGNTVIVPGVHIGNNCVIGAGSVVTKDIPDNSIACGNPCRVIREITEDDKKYYFKKRELDSFAISKIKE